MTRRKKLSLYNIGLLSIILMCAWVALVFFGVLNVNQNHHLQYLSEQKAIFNLNSNDVSPIDNKDIDKDKKYISILVEEDGNHIGIEKLVKLLPESVSFGISIYNASLANDLKVLKEHQRSYFIKLPLLNKSDNKKRGFDIDSTLSANEIKNRVEQISSISYRNSGFYNLGNKEDLLDNREGIEALISKIRELKTVLIYGVNNKTSVLEIEGDTPIVKAFDIDIDNYDEESTLKSLRALEEISLKSGNALADIKINFKNIDVFLTWYNEINRSNKFKFITINESINKKNA